MIEQRDEWGQRANGVLTARSAPVKRGTGKSSLRLLSRPVTYWESPPFPSEWEHPTLLAPALPLPRSHSLLSPSPSPSAVYCCANHILQAYISSPITKSHL